MRAVIRHRTVFQLTAEGAVEFLVGLPVVFQQVQELVLYFLFQIAGNERQLPVVLQHLPG